MVSPRVNALFSAAVLILSVGCATPPLHRAAYDGNFELTRKILDGGADVNASASYGDLHFNSAPTPLALAAQQGNVEVAKLLLDRGADVNKINQYGKGFTPLQYAAANGRLDLAKLLLERGAAIDVVARNDLYGWSQCYAAGHTALGLAAFEGHQDLAKFLIEKGAEPDAAIDSLEQVAGQVEKASLLGCAGKSETLGKAKQGLALLKRLEKRQTARAAAAGSISAGQLQDLVKAAVQGAVQAKDQAAGPAGFTSDIDKPGYSMAERPNDFALVIGIEKYSDLPEARFAERDAEAVKNHLLALGFPSRNVVLLSGEKAGYKGIEKFLESWLPRNVGEDSRVFFYFSGHGAPDTKSGLAYLVPWDGDASFLENTGYPVKRLYQKLDALKARQVIVALDACFSGAGGRSVLAQGARPLVAKADAGPVPEGKLSVFAAASGSEITSTLPDQGHGIFTYYFLKGLSGGAKDASGSVTASGLENYLKPKVQDAARRQNREQTPVLQGSPQNEELVRF